MPKLNRVGWGIVSIILASVLGLWPIQPRVAIIGLGLTVGIVMHLSGHGRRFLPMIAVSLTPLADRHWAHPLIIFDLMLFFLLITPAKQRMQKALLTPLLLIGIAGVISLITASGELDFRQPVLWLRLAAAMVVLRRVLQDPVCQRAAKDGIIIASGLAACVGILQATGLVAVQPAFLGLEGRITGPFSHPLPYAQLLCVGAVLSFHRGLNRSRLWLIPAISLSMAIIPSHSRTALIALILALLFLIFSQERRKTEYLSLSVLVGGLLLVSLFLPNAFAARIQSIPHDLTSFRLEIWRAALRMAVDNPLGVGLGQFASRAPEYLPPRLFSFQAFTQTGQQFSQVTQGAESLYLTVLAELGILGMIGVLWTLWFCFTNTMKQKRYGLAASWVAQGVLFITTYASLRVPLAIVTVILIADSSMLATTRASPRNATSLEEPLLSPSDRSAHENPSAQR